ncbi:hypothetical protein ACJMK2_022366 [Sinanodonta woodiana]|uniref:G-protein coupled receptors family 1 profile domain-containing protein n=1 Tax=Sinanodonta woodiana TaxID=1069815 RepID=A0ABD3TIT5_SINWO
MNVTTSNCSLSISSYNDTVNTSTSSATFSQFSGFKVTAENISLAITLILLDVITILGNFLVLLSFVVEPRLREPFNMYIFNLAVTDFLVAITAMTFYTINTLLGYWPFGMVMCGVWIYFDFAMTFSSVFTIVAISIDRWWSVTWPNQYRFRNTPLKTLVILLYLYLVIFTNIMLFVFFVTFALIYCVRHDWYLRSITKILVDIYFVILAVAFYNLCGCEVAGGKGVTLDM